jgi:hypothetical protein
MKYDPIELIKLNLTEESIQKMRDLVLKAMTEYNTPKVCFILDKVYLPFVVDMMDGHRFSCSPMAYNGWVEITLQV